MYVACDLNKNFLLLMRCVVVQNTDRGKFTPTFFPQRYNIKDVIVDKHPEVLAVLLNTVLYRYGKAGVFYVEFSVSVKYLLQENYRVKLRNPLWGGDAFSQYKIPGLLMCISMYLCDVP
jgi:hypothetical protein